MNESNKTRTRIRICQKSWLLALNVPRKKRLKSLGSLSSTSISLMRNYLRMANTALSDAIVNLRHTVTNSLKEKSHSIITTYDQLYHIKKVKMQQKQIRNIREPNFIKWSLIKLLRWEKNYSVVWLISPKMSVVRTPGGNPPAKSEWIEQKGDNLFS